MSRRVGIVIISIAIVIIVAGAVGGALLWLAPRDQSSSPTPVVTYEHPEDVPPDLSLDFGACKAVPLATIKSAFGDDVADIANGVNEGWAYSGGNKAQTCSYALNGTTDDAANRFSVRVTDFADDSARQSSRGLYQGPALENLEVIKNLGEAAYYNAAHNDKDNRYTLAVFGSKYLYELDLAQPADADSFTDDAARDALVTIARSIAL